MKLSKDSEANSSTAIPQPNRQSALLLVDPQNDFFPGGTMGMAEGPNLIPVINSYIQHFSRNGWPILATRDWHAPNHCSFSEQGGPHPTHCVQGSRGAQFHSDLVMPPGMMVISKGTNPKKDSRSGFEESSLADRLEDLDVKTVFVLGPATHDCFKQTIVDASNLGLKVIILQDSIRGMGKTVENLQEISKDGIFVASASHLGISPV